MRPEISSKIAVLGILVALAASCRSLDLVEEHFETRAEAISGSSTGRYSWKAQCLPPGATEIRAVTDVDTGELWTTFRHTADDTSHFESWCKPAAVDHPRTPVRQPSVGWWPADLAGRPFTVLECVRHMGYQSGATVEITGTLILDSASSIAYYFEGSLTPGCFAKQDAEPADGSTSEPVSATHCENVENLLERIDCYVTAATDSDDAAVCRQSSHEGVRYQCYAILAERRSSGELCDRIPAESPEHRSLKDACISDVAGKTLDHALCDEIETAGLRDSCYAKIGKQTGDMTLCEKIQDPGLRSTCSGEPVIVD